MQTSSSQASAALPQAASAAPLWIVNRGWDLLLFVGTPLLILPVVLLAERFFAATELYLVVAAFGALGHHLPGMMRAYGDRALFRRFKTRFIVAPIFLAFLCGAFALVDPERYAITLIAYGWGLWHGLMQTHGFLRIYDAKRRSFATTTARLDQLMCLTWFVGGVLFSQSRVHYVLEAFYYTGGPAVPTAWIDGLRAFWGSLTIVVTLAFITNVVRCWRAGTPPSPVKLLLMATSISFWLYCCLVVHNMLVGVIMFELFHDVQYLSIVWLFNQQRARKSPAEVGRLTHFIFAGRRPLIALYVGLVLLYGSLHFLDLKSGEISAVFGGILAASGLLHFYYDGFIWKVKERDTRRLLGVDGGSDRDTVKAPRLWSPHALRWVPILVLAGCFFYSYANSTMTPAQARVALGRAFPAYDLAQSNLAIALYMEGDLAGAIEANRRTLALHPDDKELVGIATNNLSWALTEQAETLMRNGPERGVDALLEEALALDANFANHVNARGAELVKRGQLADAIWKYRVALRMSPNDPHFHTNIALALAQTGEVSTALGHARQGLRLSPRDATILQLIATLENRQAALRAP